MVVPEKTTGHERSIAGRLPKEGVREGGKVGSHKLYLRTFMVLLRGQKAEIRIINGAMANGKDSNRYIRVFSAENKNPQPSCTPPSLLVTETKEFWGTKAAHLQTPCPWLPF